MRANELFGSRLVEARSNGPIDLDRLAPDQTGTALPGAMQSREVAVLDPRKLAAEFVGTAILVFAAAGTATLSFGFKLFGTSFSAGAVTTALAFSLVLMVLVYAIGPISGCHVNPAVSLGLVVAGRMKVAEAAGYWVTQVAGASLVPIPSGSPLYSMSVKDSVRTAMAALPRSIWVSAGRLLPKRCSPSASSR